MSLNVYLRNNRLYLYFDYDVSLIIRIKAIAGRKWHPLNRCWGVPLNALHTIKMLGFNTDAIEKELELQQQRNADRFRDLNVKKKFPFLYPHQIACVQRGLLNGNLLIADDCGLGKTLEALAIAVLQDKKIIIICPSVIKRQWQQEAEKWFGLKLAVIEGTPKQRIYTHFNGVILNYELLLYDYKKIAKYCEDAIVIFDEASYLKNPKSKRTILANMLQPKYVLALTGTPIETKLIDGFNIGQLVNKNWMDKSEFFNNHATLDPLYNSIIGYRNVDAFMERLKDISIRRLKEDVKDMPNKVVIKRIIPLSPQQEQISEFIKGYFKEYMKNNDVFSIEEFVISPILENGVELLMESESKLATKIKQNFLLKADSPKLHELVSTIDEMSDRKIVIFTRFKKMQEFIKNTLGNDNCIIGNSESRDKLDVITQFHDTNKRFLIVTDAFAYGVDIPFATALINFDIPWNHAKLTQRENRIYRISSKHPVTIINFVADGFEQYIYDRMSMGQKLADRFTDTIRGFIKR